MNKYGPFETSAQKAHSKFKLLILTVGLGCGLFATTRLTGTQPLFSTQQLAHRIHPSNTFAAGPNTAVCVKDSTAPVCRLASIWKDCTQGIYVDVGTNVGVQLRKLFDPWQFPNARVAGLYNETYGTDRRGVCAIGIEANPAHTPYLTTLNQYFQRKGYQALVLTETAASIRSGSAVFFFDQGSPVQWGASLTQGEWQIPDKNSTNAGTVALFDLPAFIADVVRPLVAQVQQATGIRPPVGMKLDVEGEEYALLPALITNGGLCDLDMIYMEVHRISFRSEAGAAVNMTVQAMENTFEHMRKANPRCTTRYTHIDDETYMRAHLEVPLPP